MLSRLEQHLKTLVEQKTVTGNLVAAKKLLDGVGNLLKAEGMVVRYYESSGFPSLVALSQADLAPELWLVGHIDVLDGSDKLFTLQEKPNRLIGRGVIDNKCAAAGFIEAVQQLGHEINQSF